MTEHRGDGDAGFGDAGFGDAGFRDTGFRDVLGARGWGCPSLGHWGWDCAAAAPQSPQPLHSWALLSLLELDGASRAALLRDPVSVPSHPTLSHSHRLSHALQTSKEDFTHPQRKRMRKQSL